MSESTISQRVTEELKEAMKARNTAALNVLRSLKSAIKYAAIEKHGAEGQLEENEAVGVVRKQIKQRQDSIGSYELAGRPELAASEQAEIVVLEGFLPSGLGGAEISALVEACIAEVGATSKKEMGQVMKCVQERAAGRADNRLLSAEVMKRLG